MAPKHSSKVRRPQSQKAREVTRSFHSKDKFRAEKDFGSEKYRRADFRNMMQRGII